MKREELFQGYPFGTPAGRNIANIIANIIATALLILIEALFISCDHKAESPEQPQEVEVSTPIVESVVLTHSYPASIVSSSRADVVARVNGRITAKYFTDGDYVARGQRLYSIEPVKYSSAVEQARATLRNAESQLSYATSNLDALQAALKSDAVSEMDVIQARNTRIQAEAAVASARASLRIAETNLGYCTVTAPVAGRISASLFDVGAYVGGEGAPVTLATIYDESDLSVDFAIEESQYASLAENGVQLGDSLMNRIPLLVGNESAPRAFASLYYVSPAVDPSTGTLQLKGRVTDPQSILRQGMYVKVQLPCGSDPHAILVHDASIGTDQLGKYLYVVNDSDIVKYRHIVTGELYHDTLRLVTKGISPGERYVTDALLSVRQGVKVKPVNGPGASWAAERGKVNTQNR